MKDLRGKVALLTGASRGIGPYIGRALAREGVHLALVARNAQQLEAVASELAQFGVRTVGITADITDPAARAELVRTAEAKLSTLDILVNNAGIEQVVPFANHEPAGIERILTTNLLSPMLLSRLVLPGMLARRRGHIVTISSASGKRGAAYQAAYSASKAGLIEWTGSLRVELEGTGVSASVICPGLVSKAGMWSAYGVPAPLLARESTPEQVGLAVVRELRRDLWEVKVNPLPVWPLTMLRSVSPGLANALVKRIGLVEIARRVMESRP